MTDSVKSMVVKILREYRSLPLLGESEVQINDLSRDETKFVAKGEYKCVNIWGSLVERGTFDIALGKSDLQPVRVKIYPGRRPGQPG